MNHSAIIVLIVAVAAMHSCDAAPSGEAAPSGRDCGPNAFWNDCGTKCPKTCSEPFVRACTLQCVIGCQCNEGFYKDGNDCLTYTQCLLKNGYFEQ